jgi:hypothetical protein
MWKPHPPELHPVRAPLILAVSVLALFLVALVGPSAGAQTNSPSGSGQPADSVPGPSAGSPSNQQAPNVGGDTQAGNRSTPGNGGATGGGAGAPASEASDGSSGAGGLLPVVGIGVFMVLVIALVVSSRQRRLERVGAA